MIETIYGKVKGTGVLLIIFQEDNGYYRYETGPLTNKLGEFRQYSAIAKENVTILTKEEYVQELEKFNF